MKHRRVERRQALEILYEWDQTGRELADILEKKSEAGTKMNLSSFSVRIIKGVQENIKWLNEIVERYSEDWKVDRMPVVDRNILRLGVYEIFFEEDIPVAVTINECVELAKIYGTDDSRRFINGVLGRISKDIRKIKKEVRVG